MDHWLLRAAAMRPEHRALITPDEELTYSELEARARGAAAALASSGLSAGDAVALELPAGADFVVALHGCLLSGAVAVPIDVQMGETERQARHAGASVSVQAPLNGPPAGEVEPLRLPAVATVMHTSGSTAAPRAIPLSYSNWLASALGSAVALGLDQHERWLCVLPPVHVGGLSILMRSVIYGTSVVLHGRFEAQEVTAALMNSAQEITMVSLVPTMLARLLDSGLEAPPTLRWVLLGGGPIPPGLLERARAARVPVASTYGMTEACSQIVTAGWPLPGIDVRVAEDGEILVRGPSVSVSTLSLDGWLHTGDLGAFDELGRLEVTGRKSETIVTGGENVAPAEVEAVLLEHPAVADAGVYGRPDPEWGEAVVAKVVLRDVVALRPEALRAFCAARLAAFKVPKEVEYVERLPRTESWKLRRWRLSGTERD